MKVERAVGRFIIAWGALEREIDSAIHDLLCTSIRTGAIVTANLAMRAKLDLAHALFETLRCDDDNEPWRLISKVWEQRFDTLINMTAKANAESRIPIVHSQPMVMKLESGDRPFWTRMAARKGGLRGSGITYTKAYLDEQTETVTKLVHEWSSARAHWKSAIQAIRSADADAWLNQGPSVSDHLTLQLQSNHDSPKPNRKPKQRKKSKPRG